MPLYHKGGEPASMQRVSVSLTPDLDSYLRAQAEAAEMSLSKYVAELIRSDQMMAKLASEGAEFYAKVGTKKIPLDYK